MLIYLSLILLLVGCKNNKQQQLYSNQPDMHTSKNSLDWAGIYSGTLPTAGGEGQHISLTLTPSLEYTLFRHYINKGEFLEHGSFKWLECGGVIELGSGAFYRVGEGRLFHLDNDGKKIEGSLEDLYQLHKKDPISLNSPTWRWIEINDEIEVASRISFSIDGEEGRIYGYGGCNRFFGSVDLEDGEIVLGPLGATRRYCFETADMESEFFAFFQDRLSYNLDGDILKISSDNGEMRFFPVVEPVKED